MRIVGNSRWIKCAFNSSPASTSAAATSIVMCTLPSSVLRLCSGSVLFSFSGGIGNFSVCHSVLELIPYSALFTCEREFN